MLIFWSLLISVSNRLTCSARTHVCLSKMQVFMIIDSFCNGCNTCEITAHHFVVAVEQLAVLEPRRMSHSPVSGRRSCRSTRERERVCNNISQVSVNVEGTECVFTWAPLQTGPSVA